MDEHDRIRTLHELIDQIVKLQRDTNMLVADLSRQIEAAQDRAKKSDRRKKPRT